MENNSLVTIYRRGDGRVFLHRHNRTTMGISLACPPFVSVSPAEVETVPDAVAELLAIVPDTIPHPKSFNQLEPLFELAGCRNWKQFIKGATCLNVQQTEGELLIVPTERDGAGFRHLPEAAIRISDGSLKEPLLCLLNRPVNSVTSA